MESTNKIHDVVLIDHEHLIVEALTCLLTRHLPEYQVLHRDVSQLHEKIFTGCDTPSTIVAGNLSSTDVDQLHQLINHSRHFWAPRVCLLLREGKNSQLSRWLKIPIMAITSRMDSVLQIVETIRNVVAGVPCVSSSFNQFLEIKKSRVVFKNDVETPISSLTKRQVEILLFIASGYSVIDIAKELHITTKSVDSHKYRLMNKLGIHDRVMLARFAIREGLLSA